MTCSRTLRFIGLLILSAALSRSAFADPHVIKFATLAPEGSTWMKVMTELDKDVQARTQGQVKFKMYAGGVAGDEKDVVRKVRIGQLQAAGFTGVGLGEIAPQVRVLDAPWLFRGDAEVDYIHKKFDPELAASVEKAGYKVLGWTDIGWVYVFSKNPIDKPEDMRAQKMWVWEGDPIAQAAYKAVGVDPIPLSIVDVMSSLETGLINAVYGPPMGVVAFQWFTRTKYIYSSPVAHSTGAVFISKKAFDELDAAQQKALLDASAKHLKDLNEKSRKENADALVSLQQQGLVISPRPSSEDLKHLEEYGRVARAQLVGQLYSQDLLSRVEKALADYRAGHHEGAKAKKS